MSLILLLTMLIASPTVTDLRCEYLRNPLGVDTPHPRLSWIIESERRGEKQTAYQVLAASSKENLAEEAADLWNSGKVSSDQSLNVEYAGKSLSSYQQVHWKARTWDAQGESSAWSEPATFTMALLNDSDWKGVWITSEAELEKTGSLAEASWIWHPGDPSEVPSGAERIFERTFEIVASPAKASLVIAADNEYEVFLDGKKLGSGSSWESPDLYDVTDLLVPGKHTLRVRAKNGGTRPNPAGLVAELTLTGEDGALTRISTDNSWSAVKPGEPAEPARVIGKVGVPPWGPLTVAKQPPLPLFRKEFAAHEKPRRALLAICGLGQFEAYINGRKVGDRVLDPAWSVYDKTCYYVLFDVTDQISKGENAIGVMLGKGWYSNAGDRRVHGGSWTRPLRLRADLRLEYEDGQTVTVATDESWQTAEGPIVHDAIVGGTDYDARRLPHDWSEPEASGGWQLARRAPEPGGHLVAMKSPPLKIMREFDAISVTAPEPGIFVFDFGQNASARPSFRISGKAGQKVHLIWAEQRRGQTPGHNNGKGRVEQAGIGTPQYIEYTLREGEQVWTPPFFYSGYQYVEVTGAVPEGYPNPAGLPVIHDMKSQHIRSSAEEAGSFKADFQLFNQIDNLVDWSVKSNLSHVLTDCPHREKLGWLEVPYLMWPSIAFRYDLSTFVEKVTSDIQDAQAKDGSIPTVAPNYPTFQGGFQYTPEWGAAGVFLPWQAYQWHGNKRLLEQRYKSMKAFVDYMRDTSTNLVPKPGLGDWYDYGHGQPLGASRFTPVELTAMATFAMCASIVSQAAHELGNDEDEITYAALNKEIGFRFNEKFFDGKSEYKNNGSPQTANAIALVANLVPEERRAEVVDAIVADIRERRNQQTAGDVGYRYLIRALAENNSQVLFDVNARTELGSYGGMVKGGWTSLPESWNIWLEVSLNHCMLGHVQEWFQSDLGGLRPLKPGFKIFAVEPKVVNGVNKTSVRHRSPYGWIEVETRKTSDAVEIDVTVPANTEALLTAPTRILEESGRELSDEEFLGSWLRPEERRVIRLVSGVYRFRCAPVPQRGYRSSQPSAFGVAPPKASASFPTAPCLGL